MSDWYVSSAAWTAIAQFAASGVYTVGQIVRPLTAPAFAAQYAFRCTTAGTAGTEPTWPTGNNSTVTTGGATFTNVSGQAAYGWSAAAGNLFCINATVANRPIVGDRVFLSSDHSETNATSNADYYFTSGGNGLLQIISVNRGGSVPPAPGDATAGATITCSNNNLILDSYSNTYWQGVNFTDTSAGIYFNNVGNKKTYFRNCSFYLNNTNGGAVIRSNGTAEVVWDNCTVQFGATGQSIQAMYVIEHITWINTAPAIVGSIVPTTLFSSGGGGGTGMWVLRGVDLSPVTGTLFAETSNGAYAKILIDSCRIAPGVTRYSITTNPTADEVELVNCFDGSSILSERHTPAGDLTTNRSITMTGGTQDDVGLFSHQMVSNGNGDMLSMTLDSFWMDVENTTVGSAHTATVEILGFPFNNTDVSLTLEYLGNSGSSLAKLGSSLTNALATPAALATSTATWSNIPATVANTFDPTFNPGSMTLSGGNLTATLTGSGHANTRVIYSFTSGKIYFEATALTLGSTGCGPGIGNASAGTGFLGGSVNGFQYISSGAVYTNNSVLTTIASYVVNNVICVAVDIGNRKIWYRVNNGNWNNTAGNDPGSNVGGFDLTALLASNGTIYAAFDGWQSNDSFRFNMGSTAFAQTVPIGFSSVSTGPVTLAQHIQVAFTPQQAGRLRGIVRLGKPSSTVYVNPQITVT